jgi:hypothetical protein
VAKTVPSDPTGDFHLDNGTHLAWQHLCQRLARILPGKVRARKTTERLRPEKIAGLELARFSRVG